MLRSLIFLNFPWNLPDVLLKFFGICKRLLSLSDVSKYSLNCFYWSSGLFIQVLRLYHKSSRSPLEEVILACLEEIQYLNHRQLNRETIQTPSESTSPVPEKTLNQLTPPKRYPSTSSRVRKPPINLLGPPNRASREGNNFSVEARSKKLISSRSVLCTRHSSID